MVQKIKNVYHLFQSYIARLRFGAVSKQLQVIGVTGTDGKTTTTMLIYHILKSAGKRVSYISTVSANVGGKTYATGLHTTTPDSFMLYRLLRESSLHHDEYFVMEITSHALDQYRAEGIPFAYGIVTNITHEHLDYHKTYQRYVAAKSHLLLQSDKSVINRDDISYQPLKDILQYFHRPVMTYGLNKKSDCCVDLNEKFHLPLSSFNRYNYLAAWSVCKEIGLSDESIGSAMKTFQLPSGRMDIVYSGNFTVMVDFAHTPNAIKHILETIRPQVKRRLIHVFGSAAKRDVSKRPLMGAESAQLADVIILTEEDYRNEDPVHIAEQIASGFSGTMMEHVDPQSLNGSSTHCYTIIPDRDYAIAKAISIAQSGDYIIATGKGHEQSLCRGTKEYPWDDRTAILKHLRSYGLLAS